ncbi:type II CAAX prenyl endopeptidase Rce1 family protein [Liquorilactobacillus ghanensis]
MFVIIDNFATVIILGLVFGYVFYKIKNLWTSIILHAV